MVRRLAVSMRMVEQSYPGKAPELRDALAQDWGRFLGAVLPSTVWLPVPNIEKDAVRLVHTLDADGLLLTGGDDWGTFPGRDATEMLLLHWAREQNIPVLGVCRGAQIINRFLGGGLSCLPEGSHVAVNHPVQLESGVYVQVNSYHSQGLYLEDLAEGLHPVAIASDGSIEGFTLRENGRWQGVLWHPERENFPAAYDLECFQKLFRSVS